MEEHRSVSIPSVVVFVVCYAFGVFLAAVLRPGPGCFPVLLPLVLTVCCLALRRPKLFVSCAAGCVILLGMYASSVRIMPSKDRVTVWTGHRACSCELRGIVVTDGERSGNFALKVLEICRQGHCNRASGRVRVRVKKSLRSAPETRDREAVPVYGDRVACRGRFAQMNSFDEHFLARGDDAVFWLQTPVVRLGWSTTTAPARWAFFARRYFSRRIRLFHSPEAARIMEGILLGRKTELPDALRQDAVRAGTWHIFVVSGTHVGIIVFGFMVLLKLFRLRGKVRMGLTVFFLCAYCLLTGASAPVVRATVMSCAFIFCLILERNPLFLNALCLGGLVILLFDPLQLFSRAFQLSFLSVFFIFWIYPLVDPAAIFEKHMSRVSFLSRWGRRLAAGGAVSFCAWLGTTPLIAYAFGNLSLIALIANVVIVPLSALVMAAGFSFLCVSWFTPLAGYLAAADDFFVSVFLRANRFFSRIPGASFCGFRLSLAAVVGIYLFIFLIVVILKRRKRILS